MSQPEAILLNEIRLAVQKAVPEARLFRNHAGLFWAGKVVRREGSNVLLQAAQQIHAGLHVGAADLIGWQPVTITPDMVGKTVAVFASLEIKTPGARRSDDKERWDDQERWSATIAQAGGIGAMPVRSTDQAIAVLRGAMGLAA